LRVKRDDPRYEQLVSDKILLAGNDQRDDYLIRKTAEMTSELYMPLITQLQKTLRSVPAHLIDSAEFQKLTELFADIRPKAWRSGNE
jgi:hypothetical protein